jgi:hypothetical protein
VAAGSGIIANGTYRIVARHSGKVVDVQGTATTDGANVHQWTYYGGNSQRWTVTHLGNNVYQIIGVGSGKALEVASTSTANGTNVDIRTYQRCQQSEVDHLGHQRRLLPPDAGEQQWFCTRRIRGVDADGGQHPSMELDGWQQPAVGIPGALVPG